MATKTTGHMTILPTLKTCRKGLHQYPADKKQCPQCKKKTTREWRINNLERYQKLNQRWEINNKKQRQKAHRQWELRNKQQCQKTKHFWYLKNKEHCKQKTKQWKLANLEHKRKQDLKWAKLNSEKVNACSAKRRARKKQATPSWANNAVIEKIYKECIELTKQTGIKHHVDHVFPLKNKYMCGLHVENNLQILKASENFLKGNRVWPGQLNCQKA